MDTSQHIIESINAKLTSVASSIENKLIQLNGSQEAFQERIENILERKLDNNVNIAGNVNKSIIICGNSNFVIPLHFENFFKYKDNIDFQIKKQKAVDRIITPFLIIDMILKELNNYKKTNKNLYLNSAKRLWLTQFISEIDSFSQEIENIHISEFNKIRKYLSSSYHNDITIEFREKKDLKDLNIEKLLIEIRYIRMSIKRLRIFLILQDIRRNE